MYGRTERQVRRKLAALQQQCAATGRLPDPGRKTVTDLLEAWLASAPDLKPRTRADYEDLARRYITPVLGQVRLSRLDPSHLQQVYADLQARGLRRAPAQVHALMHRALGVAVLWGWLPTNLADRVMPPRYAAPRKDVWTPEQLRQFVDATASHWLHPLWVLLVTTGCRLGEILGLRWEDVDLEQHTLTVRRGVQRVHKAWVESDPKTRAGTRTLSLPPQAVPTLRRQRVQQAEWRLGFGGGLLFALGLFSPLGSLMIAASMLTAIAKVHWPKLWATTGGFELPLVNLAVVIAVGLASGPGALALDSVYGTARPSAAFLVGGLVVVMGWLFALFTSTLTAVSDPALEQDPPTAHLSTLKR